MDTSTDELAKHTLTRGGKRLRSMEEKRRIIEEVLRGEESVASIARRHEVNANLVFHWKRLYQKGFLESRTALVPVKVGKKVSTPARSVRSTVDECVEIDLGAQKCVRLRGELARELLDRLVAELCAR
jgi:transposase-like protein